jgi:hypothetical protein
MFRYRCPKCAQLLLAHELRAGKTSVCASCLHSHSIPADPSEWLTETGEPLVPRSSELSWESSIAATPAPERTATVHPTVAHPPETTTFAHREPTRQLAPIAMDNQPRDLCRPAPVLKSASTANQPMMVRTQADITGALSELLCQRMKPLRPPRRDVPTSTAVWLVLTSVAVALVLATFTSSANHARWVGLLGVVQILIGYGWLVAMTAHRDVKRGIACAIPPLTFYYLVQWKYAKLRPLRFVVTGAVLLGLAFLISWMAPPIRSWVGIGRTTPHVEPDLDQLPKLQQLRKLRDEKAYDKLIDLLGVLTATDAQQSVEARDRPDLASEIKGLCSHSDVGVKVAAMAAYTRWGGEDARDVCLEAIQSQSQEERLMAIRLLPQWKNTDAAPEVARAIAALIGRPGVETNRARAALEEIGGIAAERAARALLLRAEDRQAKLLALNILEKVGGEDSIRELRSYANTSLDQAVKLKTLETVEVILKRLNKK